jgi:hypothetical protein
MRKDVSHFPMALSLQRQVELKDMLVRRKTYSHIAKKFSISPSTISKYRKKFHIPPSLNKGGRPRVLDEKVRRRLVHCILSGRVDTAPEVNRLLQLNVSDQTVRNALRLAGLRARTKAKKPLLHKRHLRARLDFAYTHRNKTLADWERVIWSDETKINLMGSDGRRYCWKTPGEGLSRRTIQTTLKHGGGSTMIWGCMTMKGVGRMCVIEGIMNAEKYVRILDQNLLASARDLSMVRGGFTFQQDGDPKHTSAKARNWLQDHSIDVMKWPPQSPDLNPIEHLWEHLKRKLNAYPDPPSSTKELERRIEVEWNAIDPEECRKLVASMPDRIEAVIKAKGGSTRY